MSAKPTSSAAIRCIATDWITSLSGGPIQCAAFAGSGSSGVTTTTIPNVTFSGAATLPGATLVLTTLGTTLAILSITQGVSTRPATVASLESCPAGTIPSSACPANPVVFMVPVTDFSRVANGIMTIEPDGSIVFGVIGNVDNLFTLTGNVGTGNQTVSWNIAV